MFYSHTVIDSCCAAVSSLCRGFIASSSAADVMGILQTEQSSRISRGKQTFHLTFTLKQAQPTGHWYGDGDGFGSENGHEKDQHVLPYQHQSNENLHETLSRNLWMPETSSSRHTPTNMTINILIDENHHTT